MMEYEPVLNIYLGRVMSTDSYVGNDRSALVQFNSWDDKEKVEYNMNPEKLKALGIKDVDDLFYMIITSNNGEKKVRFVSINPECRDNYYKRQHKEKLKSSKEFNKFINAKL